MEIMTPRKLFPTKLMTVYPTVKMTLTFRDEIKFYGGIMDLAILEVPTQPDHNSQLITTLVYVSPRY
jgi:hypothetical protein